jgi:pyridoxamine 5'-phosphate oxidase
MYYDELREEYEGDPLAEGDLLADPLAQLRLWLDRAAEARMPLANGMTLATAGEGGQPSARVVLLKEIDRRGLVFFTSYESRKGRELAANPRAALLLWWPPLHRQVRVEGTVERIAPEESDAYYRSRPRESNLSASASPQSRVLASRAELEERVASARRAAGERELERPGSWGGYRLVPHAVEFFQGRKDRLHDRLRYRLEGDAWRIERLAP